MRAKYFSGFARGGVGSGAQLGTAGRLAAGFASIRPSPAGGGDVRVVGERGGTILCRVAEGSFEWGSLHYWPSVLPWSWRHAVAVATAVVAAQRRSPARRSSMPARWTA